MKFQICTFSALFILLQVFSSGALAPEEDRYLVYPYVVSSHLHEQFDAGMIARSKALSEGLIDAVNRRTPYKKLRDLFLFESDVDIYTSSVFKKVPGMSESDKTSFQEAVQEMVSSSDAMWSSLLSKAKKRKSVLKIEEYGVYFDSEYGMHYFLIRFTEKEGRNPAKGPGTLRFVAVPVKGELRISGLGYEPFLFSM